MIRINPVFFFTLVIFCSCNGLKNKEQTVEMMQNQLIVTADGDTLENGFWTYEMSINGVSKTGNYSDGYKIDKWTYKTNLDSVSITWRVFNDHDVKFNIPSHLKPVDNIELPVLFQADIEDDDNNTYLVLLRYNLKEMNTSVYDYLYQYDQSWNNNSSERLISKEFKKFTFENFDIFRVKIETEKEVKYEAISYIFVVKDFLYDLTYKSLLDKRSAIDLEVFSDILYSMQCSNVKLFNYNKKKYSKEEDVVFK